MTVHGFRDGEAVVEFGEGLGGVGGLGFELHALGFEGAVLGFLTLDLRGVAREEDRGGGGPCRRGR